MPMSGFTSSTRQQRRSGGGKRYGNYRNRLDLPKGGANGTPFILRKGEWADPDPHPDRLLIDPRTQRPFPVMNDFFKVKMHTLLLSQTPYRSRELVCAAGYDAHNPLQCLGCEMALQGDTRITTRMKFIMEILHLVPYYEHPAVEYKTGDVRARQDGTGWSEFEQDGDDSLCRAILWNQPLRLKQGQARPKFGAGDIKPVFGAQRFLELGTQLLGCLGDWNEQITGTCQNIIQRSTGPGVCNSSVYVYSVNCPTCAERLHVVRDQPEDAVRELLDKPQHCAKCNDYVRAVTEVYCTNTNCNARIENDLYSVVLFGRKMGEKMASKLDLQKFMPVANFAETAFDVNAGGVDPGWLGDKTLDQRIEEFEASPFDFEQQFKPYKYEEHAYQLNLAERPSRGQGQGGAGGGSNRPGYRAPQQSQGFQSQGSHQGPPNYPTGQQEPSYGRPASPGYAPPTPRR